MPLPHRLEVVSAEELAKIHAASLKVLARTGVRVQHEEALKIFKKHGARVDGDIVYPDKRMVEANLALAPRKITWQARNPEHSRILGEGFLVQPAAGPVQIVDGDQGYRPGTLTDIADFQKIYQSEPIFDLVGMIACEPRDVPAEEKHLHLMHTILRHTDKPVNGFMTVGSQARGQLDMLAIAMGGESALANNHLMAVSIGLTTPLTFSRDPIETLFEFVRRNQIVTILTAPIAGATAPINLMGTVVLQNAEILAGIVLAQLVRPGAPVVYCPSASVADMRTGGYITGSPEGMLINIANIQMGRDFYHLPVRAMPGLTDAKTVDYQAGYETMQNLMLGMLAGAHLLNESVGILDNILAVSLEKTIIDGELIARIKRICQGIEGPDEDYALDAIHEVGPGGTFLLHDDTLEHCRRRFLPLISFWGSLKEWQEAGGEEVRQRARHRVAEILDQAPATLLPADVEKDLRIYMDREIKRLKK
jgi:trimethylamine:corrinoid methyltransferase-like protein